MVYPRGFTISHQPKEVCLSNLLVSCINQMPGTGHKYSEPNRNINPKKHS